MSITTRFQPPAGPGPSTEPAADQAATPPAALPRWRIVAGIGLTVMAALLVLFALLVPDRLDRLRPMVFLRLPVEALLLAGLVAALPATTRGRRAADRFSLVVGAGLGLLTVVKVLDMGFWSTLDRPFDLVLDLALADDAYGFLVDSTGRTGAIAASVGIGALLLAVPSLMIFAVRRLTRLILDHRRVTLHVSGGLGLVWVALTLLGLVAAPLAPLASRSAAAVAARHLVQVPLDLLDAREFARESRVDAFRDVPGDRLLTGLRGKDVLVVFVESYGRSAVERPGLAEGVDAVLADGTRQLDAAGFASRSGWLTSPTAGGGSWLAQTTLLSGLWIDNQRRYLSFVDSDRLTLNAAFHQADWRTLAVVPGVKQAWPEARIFNYDKVYASRQLGYRGPRFSWSWVPDQYVLSTFERAERSKVDRPPLMAEIPLTSSHMPWTPLPRMIDWKDVGDGSVYGPMAAAGDSRDVVWQDPDRVRRQYGQAIQYSLTTLISYLKTYGDDDTVLVFLGDHQPIPLVTGPDASHDVPITIVAKDPAVLERVSGWNWQPGLRPGPDAPVWPMSDFRDRFLTAFGPRP